MAGGMTPDAEGGPSANGRPPPASPVPEAAARRRRTPRPATAARAGTAGCATRPRRPASGPGLLVEWRQRGGSWQGRVAYTVTGPHGPALVESWLPAARLEPR